MAEIILFPRADSGDPDPDVAEAMNSLLNNVQLLLDVSGESLSAQEINQIRDSLCDAWRRWTPRAAHASVEAQAELPGELGLTDAQIVGVKKAILEIGQDVARKVSTKVRMCAMLERIEFEVRCFRPQFRWSESIWNA